MVTSTIAERRIVTPTILERLLMLRYLGQGPRPYGDHPMPPHRRMNWEFQAVLQGRIFASLESGDVGRAVSSTFWLFPPGKSHGWKGERGRSAEVFVAHYSEVPEPIERLVRIHGHLEVKLDAARRKRLQRFARALHLHYWTPKVASVVHTEKILMDLCLMFLEAYPEAAKPENLGARYSKVAAAEDWLRTRLRTSPKITDAAHNAGLSVSQLNRLFTKVRGENPKQFLTRLKVARAMRLLSRGNTKLEAIAEQCGFSSASNFCRAFKAEKDVSPTKWRRETLIRYQRPAQNGQHDYAAHGKLDRRGL